MLAHFLGSTIQQMAVGPSLGCMISIHFLQQLFHLGLTHPAQAN